MAAQQIIQLSAINVALNPHPDGIYERMIRAVYRRRIAGHVFADRHGVFSQIHAVAQNGRIIAFEGVISTFVKLDSDLPWFNAETASDASEEELEAIRDIPDHLKPNHRQCAFYFDLSSHTFIFESLPRKGGITAKQMLHFLQQSFLHPEITQHFGIAQLTVIPDRKSFEEVIRWPKIRSLYIEAHRPNPDFDEDDLQDFEQSLDDQNAKRLDMRLVAKDDAFLVPSEKVQVLAAIASENGYVEARGEDATGHSEVRSTKDRKPLVERDAFDPDAETSWDAFRRVAQNTVRGIRDRRRQIRPAREQS